MYRLAHTQNWPTKSTEYIKNINSILVYSYIHKSRGCIVRMKKKSAISTNEPDAFHSKKNGIMFWVGYKPQALQLFMRERTKIDTTSFD